MQALSLVSAALCFWAVGQATLSVQPLGFQTDPPPLRAFFEALRNTIGRTLRPRDRGKLLETLRQRKLVQDLVPENKPFPCDTSLGRSPSPPDTVHRLRPGDIDVVAAMGDSLTAGNGILAASLAHLFIENKGLSWSIGGEGNWRQFLTLPNILKEFNPGLVGFSLNDSYAHERASQFNVAEIFAMSRDLPWQAQLLVRRMRAHPGVDMQRHWKLVTVFIGVTDFCFELCVGDTARRAVENHRRNLFTTLDYLRQHMPRTLVSIVIAANLELITKFTPRPPVCAAIAPWLCPCLLRRNLRARQPEFAEVMRQWQQVEVQVAEDKRYAGLSDFSVVTQPFSKNITFPMTSLGLTDYSYFAPDCFHFIQKTDARAANALWNNMLEPVGYKTVDWEEPFSWFRCPTQERPYLYTNENSAL